VRDSLVLFRPVRDRHGTFVDAEIMWMNRAARDRWFGGATLENMRGVLIFERAPLFRAAVFDIFRTVARDGTEFQGIVSVPHPAEGEVLLDVSITPYEGGFAYTSRDVTAERASRKALQESQARYRAVTDSAADAIVTVDADGLIVSWNAGAQRVFGYAETDAVGRSWAKLLHHRHRAELDVAVQRLRSGSEDEAPGAFMEFEARRRDGGLFPVELAISVWEVAGERFATAVIRDTSARLQAQRDLSASEARFRLLAENASDVVFTASSDGVSTWVSPSITTLVGWAPEQMLGRPFIEFVHPRDRPVLHSGQADVLDGSTARYELRVRTAEGGYRWVSITLRPVFDEAGRLIGRMGGWRDVQAEVEARDALAASQARLRATIDTLLDPILLLEPVRGEDGAITGFVFADANDAACTYAGVERERLPGARMADLMPGLASEELVSIGAKTLETGDPVVLNGYTSPTAPAGSVTRHDIRVVRVDDKLSIAWHDVTEHNIAERSLRRRVEELDALRRISQLLAGSGDPLEVLDDVASEISHLLGARCARIHVMSDPSEPDVRTTSGSAGCAEFLDPEADIIHATLSAGAPVTTPPEGHVTHHHLAMPLIAGSRSVGALIVGRDDSAFSKADVAVATTVADLLAASIQNAHLHAVEKLQAASDERQRLARDLHDAVTQSLYSANLIAEALPDVWDRSPAEGRGSLLTLRRLVRSSLAELRTLLYELRPASLESAPLHTLLERLGDALKGRVDVRIETAVPRDLALPPQVKVAFYRVAQEALNNVGKHARAEHVSLAVADDGSIVTLALHDDGRGFAEGAGAGTFGLGIMRNRAEEIGASLRIVGVPGSGTSVELAWSRAGDGVAPAQQKDGDRDG
jgi:PAS domain S-box-containing protein